MTLALLYAGIAGLAGAIALVRPVRLPRNWPLLALAALPQLATLGGIRHSGLALLSLGFCLAWCWRNRDLPGAFLLGLGLSLNLLVMTFHGGAMPVRVGQLAEHGIDATAGQVLAGSKDVAVAGSPIWWLGDWLPVSTPLISLVASPGDLFVVVGLVRWLTARPRRIEAYGLHDVAPGRSLPPVTPQR